MGSGDMQRLHHFKLDQWWEPHPTSADELMSSLGLTSLVNGESPIQPLVDELIGSLRTSPHYASSCFKTFTPHGTGYKNCR